MESMAEKLMAARCRLMTRAPWYGHIAMSMVWIPSEMAHVKLKEQRTMGVRIVNNEVQCLYYPPFVESLTIKELYAVVQHEIEHIVRVHCLRVDGRQPVVWNIAADMCVNGQKISPRIGYHEPTNNTIIIPFKDQIVWIPDDFPKNGTSEEYYDKLVKHAAGAHCDCGQVTNDSEGEPITCPNCNSASNNISKAGAYGGRILDDHSTWEMSDASQDEARQIVKDIVDQASQKCQGQSPGHLQEAIAELKKPVVRWCELLHQYLGQHVGNKRSTYSRRCRRQDTFGIPGVSHHAAASVNVIVDTSGSITSKELEQFFSEIEAISSKAKTMVLQWDLVFQGYHKYRRGDWQRIGVSGRGGTDMEAPVKWLIDNRKIADVQIMLTDGYCSYVDKQTVNFPMITVITNSVSNMPTYGHVVRMTGTV